jgi:hypothetical protein
LVEQETKNLNRPSLCQILDWRNFLDPEIDKVQIKAKFFKTREGIRKRLKRNKYRKRQKDKKKRANKQKIQKEPHQKEKKVERERNDSAGVIHRLPSRQVNWSTVNSSTGLAKVSTRRKCQLVDRVSLTVNSSTLPTG